MHGYGEYFLEENDEWNNFLFPFWKNVENYKDSFSNPSTLILRRNSLYPEYKYFKNLDPILTIERYHSISRSSRCIRWKNFTKFPNSNFDKFLHPSSPLIRRKEKYSRFLREICELRESLTRHGRIAIRNVIFHR